MIPEYSLKGKVALVTGAGRGIGTGIAEVLAEAGATVLVNALTDKFLSKFVKDLQQSSGSRVVGLTGDVTTSARRFATRRRSGAGCRRDRHSGK